jgi:hypothetical protein
MITSQKASPTPIKDPHLPLKWGSSFVTVGSNPLLLLHGSFEGPMKVGTALH